ncbi:MAG: hypothetical protein CVU42_07825 [Chloroflexi bacterium HGW-Chloroflexi-4]|nr:MAG: hypothetical protein CVU42_07825 [Chloroflexi bacterium HGW-Chloroflexi-4]
MLDDLRNSASSAFEEDPLNERVYESTEKSRKSKFLGMNAGQRFVIALFVFLMIAIVGVFVLIVFQKIYPPI